MPSIVLLVAYLANSLQGTVTQAMFWDTAFQVFFWYFIAYAGSTLMFQVCEVVGEMMSRAPYMCVVHACQLYVS